ncbi:MAG: hypothetical protein NT069_24535 [Planctomycetota bacterium]|nr:hypothetical protein [Planctomycetota bacterium]
MTATAPEAVFQELERLNPAQPLALIDHLISQLRGERNWHALFDALLMRRRQELGLPLVRPTSLRDVPEAQRDEFEKFYVDSARDVGKLLLEDGLIAQAWNYFRAINEPETVAAAIEALPHDAGVDEQVVEIALFQAVAPVKGLQLFLQTHGTCSTITALDQQFAQMTPATRAACARVMIRRLYDDLRGNVEHDVKRRQPMTPPGASLRELIAGREFLFNDDNYHIDVSHLNSVVRFARMLEPTDAELELALQLAQYGSRLAAQYQYGGNPPFTEFYPAHIRYFQALLNQDRDQAIDFFRKQITGDPAETDTQLAAYALVDLLIRLDRNDEALDLALQYLSNSADEFGLSIPELCVKAKRYDRLREYARGRGDLLNFTAALLSQ